MTFVKFNSYLEKTFEECRKLICKKGSDYTDGLDRFHNFNRVSATVKVSPELVLWVYLEKHLAAIGNYVANGKVESEPIDGRILDAITYLLLLRGLVAEKTQEIKDSAT